MYFGVDRWIYSIKLKLQKIFRGYSDDEVYDFFDHCAQFIVDRLTVFNKNKTGHPPEITFEEWTDIIDRIIGAFEVDLSISRDDVVLEYSKKEYNTAKRLFNKYFHNLWD